MAIETINPATNEVVKRFEPLTVQEIDNAIEVGHRAYLNWKEVDFPSRSELMKKCASILRDRKEEYAALITLEVGKLESEAIAEIEKCALVCDYYANNAQAQLESEIIESDASKSYVRYDPIGIVLAVMPWNFPFWQFFRFAAPTIMAGNTGLLKHASNVPQCAIAMTEVFLQAGFPQGVMQNLLISSGQVRQVIEHEHVHAVTLTGSEPAGASVASIAGANIKKSLLELGGSDPFIVLKDADLEKAVEVAVSSRLLNCGQSCIAAKRFIVHEDLYIEFLEGFKQQFDQACLAPMAREDLAQELLQQVNKAVSQGAVLEIGGNRPQKSGAWFEPTILAGIDETMEVYAQELFGPVAMVFSFKELDEAIELANATEFGLGATVFTKDMEEVDSIASRIDSGAVFVNGLVKSDPRLPFGGTKKSGFGRELSALGIKEFVNAKTVWVA